MPVPTVSHNLPGIPCGIILFLCCVCWDSRHVEHFYDILSIFIYVQPVYWVMWSKACFCHLCDCCVAAVVLVFQISLYYDSFTFSISPSIMAVILEYPVCAYLMFYLWLVEDHPFLMSVDSSCRHSSSCITSCISFTVMLVRMSLPMSIMSVFKFKPVISSSFLSQWFCLDNQSVMYRSGPGLYYMFKVY